MDTKISDAILAVGVSVIIIMFMVTAEELIGIKFMSIVAMVAIVRWVYRWVRSWDI